MTHGPNGHPSPRASRTVFTRIYACLLYILDRATLLATKKMMLERRNLQSNSNHGGRGPREVYMAHGTYITHVVQLTADFRGTGIAMVVAVRRESAE